MVARLQHTINHCEISCFMFECLLCFQRLLRFVGYDKRNVNAACTLSFVSRVATSSYSASFGFYFREGLFGRCVSIYRKLIVKTIMFCIQPRGLVS